MSTSKWVRKLLYPYNGILHSNKKDCRSDTYNDKMSLKAFCKVKEARHKTLHPIFHLFDVVEKAKLSD